MAPIDPISAAAYREIRSRPRSRERALAFAQLARDARARGELQLAIVAKLDEVHDASMLQMNQHCLVAAGEMIELYDDILATGAKVPDAGRKVVWGLKYAVGNALGVPEIPFATVDELIAMLGRVLETEGYRPYAMWQTQASRFHRSGDLVRVATLTEALLPTISAANHTRNQTDCPSCSFYELARYKGTRASASEVEAILRPVLRGEETCEESPMLAESLYAIALAGEARADEARVHADRALGMRRGAAGAARIEPVVARLEAARVADDTEAMGHWLGALSTKLETLEDAYDRLGGMLVALRAARRLAREGHDAMSATRTNRERDALALAQRLDARLEQPRHLDEVREALRASG